MVPSVLLLEPGSAVPTGAQVLHDYRNGDRLVRVVAAVGEEPVPDRPRGTGPPGARPERAGATRRRRPGPGHRPRPDRRHPDRGGAGPAGCWRPAGVHGGSARPRVGRGPAFDRTAAGHVPPAGGVPLPGRPDAYEQALGLPFVRNWLADYLATPPSRRPEDGAERVGELLQTCGNVAFAHEYALGLIAAVHAAPDAAFAGLPPSEHSDFVRAMVPYMVDREI